MIASCFFGNAPSDVHDHGAGLMSTARGAGAGGSAPCLRDGAVVPG